MTSPYLIREAQIAHAARALRPYRMIDHHNFVVAVLIGAGFSTAEADDLADDAARVELKRRRAMQ